MKTLIFISANPAANENSEYSIQLVYRVGDAKKENCHFKWERRGR